jgi:hypothetical protein
MPSVLFIHRSVGRNLLHDGQVYAQIGTSFELHDFDQNTGILSSAVTEEKSLWKIPGNDTRPGSYAELLSFEKQQGNDPTLADIMKYDVIVIKSCYPNSNLKSREELETAQKHYQSIISFFNAQPDKKLLILTSPPLISFKTNPENAARARALANWLAENKLASNVFVFNLFDELADKSTNLLRKEYRRRLPWDAHPNAFASRAIAPKFVDFLRTAAANQ